MSKTTKTRANYNDAVLAELKKKYPFDRKYLLMSIRGDRTSENALKIKEDYERLCRAAESIIKNEINNN